MTQKCRLCGNQADLQNSHIIPRFVIKWLKDTGATPFLRGAEDPDTRFQDYHEKLLCSDCEAIFSDYEREFATNIFHPYINKEKQDFEYGEWLQRFVISVSWRLIVSDLSKVDELDEFHREAIRDAEAIWEKVLLGKLPLNADPFTHHIYFLGDLVVEEAPDDIPDKFEWYISRGIDGTSVYGKHTAIYFKFPQMVFFSCIQPPEVSGLEDTEIGITGEIGPPQVMGPDWGTFLNRRAKIVTERDVSQEEQEKIMERMLDDLERVAESDSLETFRKRWERKMVDHNPLDYLNEECPVCYTRHDVVEFLPVRPLRKAEIDRMNDKNELVKAIYMCGELSIEGVPEDLSPTFILSTMDSTKIISLYEEVGWVVEDEINHSDEVNPVNVGEAAFEGKLQSYKDWVREQRE